jgi:hypothetical protein
MKRERTPIARMYKRSVGRSPFLLLLGLLLVENNRVQAFVRLPPPARTAHSRTSSAAATDPWTLHEAPPEQSSGHVFAFVNNGGAAAAANSTTTTNHDESSNVYQPSGFHTNKNSNNHGAAPHCNNHTSNGVAALQQIHASTAFNKLEEYPSSTSTSTSTATTTKGNKSAQHAAAVTAPEVNHWTEIMSQGWTDHSGGSNGNTVITNWDAVLSDFDLQQIERYWERLMPTVSYLGTETVAKIYKSLCVAYRAHRGQMRKSGDPFIIHPVEVAILLSGLKMDGETVMAGLLHDTVEDTDLTFAQVESLFGYTVRSIVEGETSK